MPTDAWRHYWRARLLQLLRRPQAAIAAYRCTLELNPAHQRARHRLAYLLAESGRDAEAEAELRDLTRHDPRNASAWFNLGFLCDRRQATGDALAAFRTAVALNPKFDQAWYGLGLALVKQGQDRDAIAAFEQVVQLQPMNGHAMYALGMAWHRLQEPDKVRGLVLHLDRFDRHQARRLIEDTGRDDLAHVIADLRR